MSRFLVTTADERSWKFDRPVLFLGEWCRLYDRKSIWEGMDAIVAEPYGLQVEQKERDLEYLQTLSGRLLVELTDALNAFHNTTHSSRYWNVVLGHWLQRYVAVTFNLYFTLDQALKNYEVSGTTVFDFTDYSLATPDSMAFMWACEDEVWNHVLCARILKFWGNVKIEKTPAYLPGISGFGQEENKKDAFNPSISSLMLKMANYVMSKFVRTHDAFIIKSYLPLMEEIKLQLALGQFPQLWRSPKPKNVRPDFEKRRHFEIVADKHTGFERFVRSTLGDIIPTCYLEGYNHLVQQTQALSWPSAPKFIYTSNNYDADEIFKIWTGSKIEKGVPYFVGQHGSNYGTLLGSQYWPELLFCDSFFSWGWSDGNPKVIPAFNFKIAGQKSNRFDPKGGLLLIENCVPRRISPMNNYFEFGIYQEEQFRFVEALPKTIQNSLTVRLHQAYINFHWFEEQRWKDRSPHTCIETGTVKIQELVAQSRLVIYSYDSTGILEALAMNIPTMCFWHGGLDHLLPSAKPYYELLRDANILADTPEQAAKLIALHWDDVGAWWRSQKVQNAREKFCNQYSKTVKEPVRTLKELLMTTFPKLA